MKQATTCPPKQIALRNGGVAMSTLLRPLIRLLTSIQTVWSRLIKYIDKDTAKLVFVSLTVLMIFETVLMSLLVALVILRSF
jgi:hypothetical protein